MYRNNKYNNKRVEYEGIKFDSIKEMKRYAELKLLVRSRDISNLKLQPRFILQAGFTDEYGIKHLAITYTPDFEYLEKDRPFETVEDVKGMKTDIYRLKKKLFIFKYTQYRFIET